MSNRFLAGLITLAFCCAIALPAYAQSDSTPEKKALIKELLGLTNAAYNSEAIANQIMDKLQATVTSQFSNEMREWIQAQKVAPAEQKRLQAIVDETIQRILTRVRAEVPKRINYGELIEKIGVEIYNKHFTEAEVKELIAFNKTPTAQKYLKILPQITAEIMPGVAKSIPPEPTQFAGELVEKVAHEAYNKRFTEAEVKELIAFSKTSTAQKFAKILPQIIAEMTSMTEKLIAPELIPLIDKIVDDELMKLTPKRN